MGRNRVKPEQASKVLMRMPTLRSFGEGRTRGEAIDTRTHAIRRGSGHGTSEGWFAVTGGDPFADEGSGLNVILDGGAGGSRTASYDRRGRVMPAEERTLTSGMLSKMARRG